LRYIYTKSCPIDLIEVEKFIKIYSFFFVIMLLRYILMLGKNNVIF